MIPADLEPIIDFINKQKPNFQPKIALVLGSGLGELAEQIQNKTAISFNDIPGFPRSTVVGHKGQMVLGTLGNMPVACMQGRIHGYEGVESDAFKIFIRTLKLLGCEIIFITNSSGSLRPEVTPGHLSLINDHINFSQRNPLIGINDEEFGPRFVAMTDVYDAALRIRFHQVAAALNIDLTEGVYGAVSGPCFETPAEIRMFRTMGIDLVGMSTVQEVIMAKHCGMRVAAIASVTNLAAGMSDETLSHSGTIHFAQMVAKNLSRLIINVLESLAHDPC